MLLLFNFFIILFELTRGIPQWKIGQCDRKLFYYNETELKILSNLSNYTEFYKLLSPILVERIVDTESHRQVGEYLKETLDSYGFKTVWDEFVDKTPYGLKKFRNLIATYKDNVLRRLVLACHYDSKILPNQIFIGAIDSAVPCAMLLDLARTLKLFLEKTPYTDVTLQLLFLDGEEAFVEWTKSDSIYGARHLAKLWNSTINLTKNIKNLEISREIERIDVFILLDLLGASNPSILNTIGHNTDELFKEFIKIEKNLKKFLFKGKNIFKKQNLQFGVEDDHLPFKELGVPILHLISTPFPPIWHTVYDNANNLNNEVIYNLNTILRVFVAQYLHLRPLNNYHDE